MLTYIFLYRYSEVQPSWALADKLTIRQTSRHFFDRDYWQMKFDEYCKLCCIESTIINHCELYQPSNKPFKFFFCCSCYLFKKFLYFLLKAQWISFEKVYVVHRIKRRQQSQLAMDKNLINQTVSIIILYKKNLVILQPFYAPRNCGTDARR